MRITNFTLALRSSLAVSGVLLVCVGAPAQTTQPTQATATRALPVPAVVSMPRTFSAATYARAAMTGMSTDDRALPQGQFVSPAHTFAERSTLLDRVTRERYREAMALNAARGEGTRITFRKARF
jgi:hypothetical protein